jgi:hypothetical protein
LLRNVVKVEDVEDPIAVGKWNNQCSCFLLCESGINC